MTNHTSSRAAGGTYFEAARQWLIAKHGAENLIFSVVHHDELTPHMVAYVVPIHEGGLNAKRWLGGKAKLSAMQTDFAKVVGQRFGLDRGIEGSQAKHTTVKQFYAAINAAPPVMPRIEVSSPPLLGREQWAEAEGKRIAESLRPVLRDAARASQWGRFQDKGRREAQATAKRHAEKAEAAETEAHQMWDENRLLKEAIREWASVYDDGLTDDQAARLATLADQMRSANRLAAAEAPNAPADHTHQDNGPAPGR